jgi:hypothetical protein
MAEKIILVGKPSECPFNCDGYCSKDGSAVDYCNDYSDCFPDMCPLSEAIHFK